MTSTLRETPCREAPCVVQASGAIEQYFYGELAQAEHESVETHVAQCRQCREALEELRVISKALASRPIVTSPLSGDWAGFMTRLDERVARDTAEAGAATVLKWSGRRRYHAPAGYLAMAALVALVTMSVVFVARSRHVPAGPASVSNVITPAAVPTPGETETAASFAAASEEHFERSKLVVLGLATKDPQVPSKDWTYERELASDLLNDTRIYRMAAEDRGMNTVAGVMRDLELVLLQTSLTDATDPAALAQIQRLIQKRDLVEKINVVATTGL